MASRIAYIPHEEPPKRRPVKKPDYLSWIHELPCCVTGQSGVQAAHVSYAAPWYGHYGRARGTKAPDLFALPLIKAEHDRQHSMNEEVYWLCLGIDPHLLGLTLWGIYSNYEGFEAVERARSRILSGLASPASLPTRDR
jgi:hypothetical protein